MVRGIVSQLWGVHRWALARDAFVVGGQLAIGACVANGRSNVSFVAAAPRRHADACRHTETQRHRDTRRDTQTHRRARNRIAQHRWHTNTQITCLSVVALLIKASIVCWWATGGPPAHITRHGSTDTQTRRHRRTDAQTHRNTKRDTETHRDTETQTHRDTQRQRQRDTQRRAATHRHAHKSIPDAGGCEGGWVG